MAELRNGGVDAFRRRNIDETMRVAHRIVEQILDSAVVSLDMICLKNELIYQPEYVQVYCQEIP